MERRRLQEPPAKVAGIEPLLLVLLAVAAVLAGFIDSQVGGGGVITLPALLAAGLPPHAALATNKLAATGASSVAALQYVRARLVEPLTWVLLPVSVLTSAVGAWVVLRIAATDIRALVLVVIVAMALYVLLRPRFGQEDRPARRTTPAAILLTLAAAAIGFYDGLLGPGTGTFLLFSLTGIWGLAFVRAAASGRVLNFGSNVGALGVFVATGHVDWLVGGTMVVGTVTGGFLGAHATIRGGSRWIRSLFVAMALALAARIASDVLA